MVFEPFWVRPLKIISVVTMLIVAYAWTSADDWEDEFEQPPVYPTLNIAEIEEPEPVPPQAQAEEAEPVFVPAPEGVVKKTKRAVTKAKRKIRQALKNNN